jgi:tRNA threonylcarbamoyladenosine modification (KEOPS) complex Cgi121 subunit
VSGKRQVADAIRVAGLRLDSEAVGLVLFGPTDLDDFLREMAWSRDDSVMSAEEKSLEAFGISKAQATTVSYARRLDLVLEKVALVDLEK